MAMKKTKVKGKSNSSKMSSKSPIKASGKIPTIKEPLSKSKLVKIIIDSTGFSKKHVLDTIECLSQVIEKSIKSGGPGKFVLPGLLKISVVKKPARPAREGINPFNGEKIMIKAKPARKIVKVKPLKKLKDMVA